MVTLPTSGLAWSPLVENRPGTRDGGDPLGFRSFATRLAREIAPGLTQSTGQARAFGVLCLGLRDFGMIHADGNWAFVEFETFWACAQAQHFMQTPELNRWRGKRAARWRVLEAEATGEVDLTVPVLKNQVSTGIWGSYRRSAGLFGLTRRATRRARPESGLLTPQGQDLADATSEATRSAAGTGVKLVHQIKKRTVAIEGLRWIRKDGKLSHAELAVLNTGVRAFDAVNDGRLAALWHRFDESGELSIAKLASDDSLPQAEAVAAAAAVLRLVAKLERPLREWAAATGGKANVPASVWKSADWDHVEAWGEHELLALRQTGSEAASGLTALRQHQRWLAEIRGSQPWEEGMAEPAVAQFAPPTFALPAVTAIFQDGLNPSA